MNSPLTNRIWFFAFMGLLMIATINIVFSENLNGEFWQGTSPQSDTSTSAQIRIGTVSIAIAPHFQTTTRTITFELGGKQKNMTIIEGYVQPPPTRSPNINIPEANYTPVKDLLSVTDTGSSWQPTSVASSSSTTPASSTMPSSSTTPATSTTTTTSTSTGSSLPASSSSPSVASPS
ncbi:MAG: hypothetical protein HQM08_09755 [Candidatus Riflebacteria bacterium]|nr:hypothetical protein [Candidatus Riflebacteria bacterium]